MKDFKFLDSKGDIINISVIGFFQIPELDKKFIMYGLVDDNPDNDKGRVLLGEVIIVGDTVKILGILEEERDLVVAYYNEISSQVGGDNNE